VEDYALDEMQYHRLKRFIGLACSVPHQQAYTMIKEGRVLVNGSTAEPHRKISHLDEITVDGKRIEVQQKQVYVLFNKPRGIECTLNRTIENNLLTVFDHPVRLFPVGRLDKESEGLLLMINDGDLYHEVAHADSQKEKEYYVEVHQPITNEFLNQMRSGVKVLNTVTDPCEVFPVELNACAFRIILKQGMNRQIRRMCYNLGFSVHKLVRTRIMHLHLGDLKAGEWRELTADELQALTALKSGS
jgi:23S rRNA pseudouridine2604 synthase